MMIDKRLIGTVGESKRYIAGNVLAQWCALAANIVIMADISLLLERLYHRQTDSGLFLGSVICLAAALIVRFVCSITASRMSFLAAKTVKKKLRGMIYRKLLELGASYREKVKTSEVVQVAVEGVDQLETYFGSYLPQFFYAMLAPFDAVCSACLCESARGGRAADLCSPDPCLHCGGADLGEEAAWQILGKIHGSGRYLSGKTCRG